MQHWKPLLIRMWILTLYKDKLKKDMIKLTANQIDDKMTKRFNDTRKRLGIKRGASIVGPIRSYDNFDLKDNDDKRLRIRK